MKHHIKRAAALMMTGIPLTAQADDHMSLEHGIPLEVEDAYPTAFMNREIHWFGAYKREESRSIWSMAARFEYGFVRNWEGSLMVPYRFGSGVEDDGIGDVELEALYNFNREGKYLPAVSLTGTLIFPTAEGSDGIDTSLGVLATKTLGWSSLFHRVHFNGFWHHNTEAATTERSDRYKLVFGYDVRITPDTMLLADFVREQEVEKGVTTHLFEIGVRTMLNPLTVIGVGVGFGLDSDSPDFQAMLGLQRSF